MAAKEKAKHILAELKGHAPFTAFGAILGLVFMFIFRNVNESISHNMFLIFHPTHVVLSALVTASMFKIHTIRKNIVLIVIIGYFGSVGIATLSDIIIPHFGGKILSLDIPTHAQLHEHDHEAELAHADEHTAQAEHASRIHFGFIEEWYIVNPAAFLGIAIAMFLPRTKFPHAAHVLISTWASSSYLLMDMPSELPILSGMLGIFIILFIATWMPCCISDIVFPLIFVKSDLELVNTCSCTDHALHSHPHIHRHSDKCPQGEDGQ